MSPRRPATVLPDRELPSVTSSVDPVRVEFARRLEVEFRAKGWTQADLVRAAAPFMPPDRTIAPYDISNYMRHRSLPRADKLTAICMALGVVPDSLLPRRETFGPGPAASGDGGGAGPADTGAVGSDAPVLEFARQPDGTFLVKFEGRVGHEVAMRLMTLLAKADGEPPA